MLVTPGAATKRVDRLAAAGLVTRERVAGDGRARVVTLTAAGRRLTDRLLREHLATEERLLSTLDDEERRVLGDLLGRLLAAVE